MAGAAFWAWGEWVNRRWSRTLVGSGAGVSEAVVVPGYRNPGPRANAVNRWRVRAGVRSVAADRAPATREERRVSRRMSAAASAAPPGAPG